MPAQRTSGLPDAGTMPAEPVTADWPTCWRCSWTLIGCEPPVWGLKLLSGSCEHAQLDSVPWDYARYAKSLRLRAPRPSRGYVPPALFLGEIADTADDLAPPTMATGMKVN